MSILPLSLPQQTRGDLVTAAASVVVHLTHPLSATFIDISARREVRRATKCQPAGMAGEWENPARAGVPQQTQWVPHALHVCW